MMAEIRRITKRGVKYLIYQKSIRIDGVPGNIFFQREPNGMDIEFLDRVVELGEHRMREKIKAIEKQREVLLNGRL